MTLVLGIALAGTLLLMVFWRRHLGSLMQIASLLGSVLLLIWLQDNGYLGGKNGRPPPQDSAMPRDRPR
ncbi:hypothetical protein [Methylobacterium haplocladii]|uniref:Uncharacterized protein n=1 Tax=Methylobacterium haplocladii TaxID=1176176 RepID=A0A512IRY5_9HYPH|nr:hypothetical protein [Methylobacterium haplocladii]GEP00475.1 hypothetical protein MHA02_28620 [Methylobacterium haplocladii]GJD82504.1 hypothetical protein HPGCJGGD_0361 [Methylobacterium haplocladii]GLS59588.1 hypothetical protein GCM10007887_22570 [Methylobacterium haplocladii]